MDLDIKSIITETNSCLKLNQQIHPDDPIMVNVILNERILSAQLAAVKRELHTLLTDRFDRFSASIEEQVRRAELSSERTIANGGNQVEAQLDAAAQRWEERLKVTGRETQRAVQRASQLAWSAAIAIAMFACILVGSSLGNLVFGVFHHQDERGPERRHPALTARKV